MLREDLIEHLTSSVIVSDNFLDYLKKIISRKGLTEVEVYKKVNLDRRIFSKLRCDKNYHPSKRTILTIAFSLELNIDEVEDLLNKGGYALSDCIQEDIIISKFFKNKIYDLFAVNEMLYQYGLRTFEN